MMDPTRSAKSTDLENEDLEILGMAVRIAMNDPTYLERVRVALERWKASH